MIKKINDIFNNYFRFTENISNYLIYFLLSALCILVWVEPFAFFRGDDWSFIIDYAESKSFNDYVFVAHGAHVIPFFQLFYNIELLIFGKNAICFQALSVLIFSFIPYVFYLILKQISSKNNQGTILLVSLLLSLHPNFADIIFWIFQQGVIIHILFQLLSIFCYFNYLKNNDNKNLYLFFTFLVIQNYFFGNGILFPLLFIVDYIYMLFFSKIKSINYKFLGLLIVFQIFFLIVQSFLSLQSIDFFELLNNFNEICISLFRLIHVSITRFLFIRQIGGNFSEILASLLFLFISYNAFKNDRRLFMFSVIYLFSVSISIPIARFDSLSFINSTDVHYYYSILLFPPLALITFLAVSKLSISKKKYFFFILVSTLMGYLFVNIQVKKIFSYKHLKNKEGIVNAIKYSKKNYYPFEDQMYSCGKSFRLEFPLNNEIQKSSLKSSYFGYDSTIVKIIGEDCFKSFLINNNKMIKSFKFLEKKSMFNLDITYEKNE
jgi:hypothetical protein